MVKKNLILSLVIVVLFTMLTGCGDSRTGAEESAVKEDVTNKILKIEDEQEPDMFSSSETETKTEEFNVAEEIETTSETYEEESTEQTEEYYLEPYEVELTEEMFQSLPDVPDWNSDDAFSSFEKGFEPSNELIKIYNEKAIKDELTSDNGLKIFHKGNYITNIYYKEESGYYFRNALFKENGNVVKEYQDFDRKITKETLFADGTKSEEKIELDTPDEEGYMRLTTVSLYRETEAVEYYESFSVYYDLKTSETVCIRFGEEIGKRTKIDLELIKEFNNYREKNALTIGYINDNNELIYPIIVEDNEGISFKLLKQELNEEQETLIHFSSAIVNDTNFKVFNNKIYIIDNVKYRIDLNTDGGWCYGVWVNGKEKVREVPIEYSKLKDIEVEIFENKRIEISAMTENILLFGADEYIDSNWLYHNRYRNYVWNAGFVDYYIYDVGETEYKFKCDNWDELKIIITALKESKKEEELNEDN